MSKLINPRGYLSWTQVSLWVRSPEKYVSQYMHGEEGFHNSGMEYGSRVSHALVSGEQDEDEMINMLTIIQRHCIIVAEIIL